MALPYHTLGSNTLTHVSLCVLSFVLQWAMPSYKLTHYNTTGLAEVTRYMFKLKNVPFEDVRLTREQWLELKPSEWNRACIYISSMFQVVAPGAWNVHRASWQFVRHTSFIRHLCFSCTVRSAAHPGGGRGGAVPVAGLRETPCKTIRLVAKQQTRQIITKCQAGACCVHRSLTAGACCVRRPLW